LLDFSQGAPADLVLLDGAQALADDLACATEDAPDARSCLRLNAGSSLALRLAGPLVGLRIEARVQLGLGGPTPVLPSTTLVAADGTPWSGDVANAFESPVEDVFALVAVPATFNTQLDPACANAVAAVVLVDAIEPVPSRLATGPQR
jgi:hypothetical protein